jgi:hypothetical protein
LGLLLEQAENSLLEIGTQNDTGASTSSDQIAFSTGGTRRLFIQGDGKIGIGDTAPDELLTVKGASPRIHIKNTDETNGGIKFSDADAISTQQFELLYDSSGTGTSGGNLKFRSDNTDNILVMDPNGSIAIYTAPP